LIFFLLLLHWSVSSNLLAESFLVREQTREIGLIEDALVKTEQNLVDFIPIIGMNGAVTVTRRRLGDSAQCHFALHKLGEEVFQVYPNLNWSSQACAATDCLLGCLHGLMLGYFKATYQRLLAIGVTKEEVIRELSDLHWEVCTKEISELYYMSCSHSLGHPLYNLLGLSEATKSCSFISIPNVRNLCYQGAYMQLWSDKRSGLIKSNITSAKLLCSSHPSSCYSFFFRYYNMKMFGFNELYSFVSNPFLSRVRQIHVKICESLPTSFERTGCFFRFRVFRW